MVSKSGAVVQVVVIVTTVTLYLRRRPEYAKAGRRLCDVTLGVLIATILALALV